MKESLEKELQLKHPQILIDLYGNEYKTCMAFGIECQDGWYDLLDNCMEKIQSFCDSCSKDGNEVKVIAAQIKSKFATLRFYVDIYGATEQQTKIIYDIINEAEDLSAVTCEVCGKPGEISTKGWHTTLCGEHKI